MNPYEKRYKNLIKSSDKEKWEKMLSLQMKSLGLPAPKPHFKFHSKRKWSVDFAWPDFKIIVEIEGGIWSRWKSGQYSGTGHSHPLGILRDMEKYNAAGFLGYRVFRFAGDEVKSGEAVTFIQAVLEQAKDQLLMQI